ncbi:MAG: hypothetical protein WCG36_07665 [bacterium]
MANIIAGMAQATEPIYAAEAAVTGGIRRKKEKRQDLLFQFRLAGFPEYLLGDLPVEIGFEVNIALLQGREIIEEYMIIHVEDNRMSVEISPCAGMFPRFQ